MLSGINSATGVISLSYADALKRMSESLKKIGSGKRFQNASEDIGAYLKVASIQNSKSMFESALESVSEADAFLTVASGYASSLIDDLTNLKTEAYNIENTTGAEQVAAQAKFDGYRASIQDTLGTSYNGDGLNISADKTFQNVNLANGNSLALSFVVANDAVTYANTAWDNDYATTEAAIDAEIAKVSSFSAKVGGYEATIDSQDTFISTMIANLDSAQSSITAINVLEETTKYVAHDVRQQAAVSIMAQANLSRRAILNLFK